MQGRKRKRYSLLPRANIKNQNNRNHSGCSFNTGTLRDKEDAEYKLYREIHKQENDKSVPSRISDLNTDPFIKEQLEQRYPSLKVSF